eukprot:TRINITY_DN7771_c0_g2_i1.p1 TRINITY_DN7771_c0_g2~~TRINITY_DN7771_c0_g2_i1.p1  ORF type:complete len:231 (+),score=56.00 TRINITY_DN7771_c0_g2_i1:113-805(+)
MSAAQHIRLTYFDFPGVAERIRLALFIGGIAFEDERISYEEVAKRRAEGQLPYGQVPVLSIDGSPAFGQSGALLRWAGRKAGLYPDDPIQQLRCDAIEDALGDIVAVLKPQWYGSILARSPVTGQPLVAMSEEQKSETARALIEEVLPARLAQVERALGDSDYFFCGDALTICDLSWYVMASGLQDGSYCAGIPASVLDACPKLLALMRRVAAQPRVAEWNARGGQQEAK